MQPCLSLDIPCLCPSLNFRAQKDDCADIQAAAGSTHLWLADILRPTEGCQSCLSIVHRCFRPHPAACCNLSSTRSQPRDSMTSSHPPAWLCHLILPCSLTTSSGGADCATALAEATAFFVPVICCHIVFDAGLPHLPRDGVCEFHPSCCSPRFLIDS